MSGVGKCPETDVLEGLAEKAFKQVCERVDVGVFFFFADVFIYVLNFYCKVKIKTTLFTF